MKTYNCISAYTRVYVQLYLYLYKTLLKIIRDGCVSYEYLYKCIRINICI